ncbi:MAG: hypothetical protein EZS28_005481 [Streblomastix strix]|uniref:Uncharacterized protein n=1 Tax=Streblomastix strix TaxID=222440 RepID=A0A5J4WXA5_9EUKA|nr:MAG: hypothetical protein EZS28_005481 [Streblomastix strix]
MTTRFMERLNAHKLYILSKQMAYEDRIQRFPAINNTFSKTETQQKMTYAHAANSQEKQLRFFMVHGPGAQLIANSKSGQPVALLPRPSAPLSSSASNIDDSDQDLPAQQKKKNKRTEKSFSESSSTLGIQCINFEFKQIQSLMITTKRQTLQSTTLQVLPQRRRISERNGQDSVSSQSFLVRSEQDGTERLLEKVSRTEQMAIRELMVYFGTSRNTAKRNITCERDQEQFILHIPLKDKVGIKSRATQDQPQRNSYLLTIIASTPEGAITTEREDTGNRIITSEHRIARDALRRILND